LDLCERPGLQFGTREQFIAYSASVMRSLLVDLARRRVALKRSAEVMPLTVGVDAPDTGGTPEQLVVLDEALTRLGKIDTRLLRIAEMSVIMGMSVRDMATALGVSEPTVKLAAREGLSIRRAWDDVVSDAQALAWLDQLLDLD